MKILSRALNAIPHQAIQVLAKEMGAADTMRFLGQFSTGTGNDTEEREALFDHLTLDDMLAETRGIEADNGKTQTQMDVTTSQP